MDGIKNFLKMLNDNWTNIIIIIGLLIVLYERVKDYLSKSKEEKVKLALEAIKRSILAYMSDAEMFWGGEIKSGKIKRSAVIAKIYQDYPILAEYVEYKDLEKTIDHLIDLYKPFMDNIISGTELPEGYAESEKYFTIDNIGIDFDDDDDFTPVEETETTDTESEEEVSEETEETPEEKEE